MDDFDRSLEFRLRRMLDPVAATRPPSRARRRGASDPVLALQPLEPAPSLVEPVPVTVAVAPLLHL